MQINERFAMKLLLQEMRRNPLLWLLVFVPIALAAEKFSHEAHTLHFVFSVLAILPLAVLLSHATESVAAKTGDSVGGLLNATLGNLTELVIAIAALQAGEYTLVKASVAGAIVTNSLFMLGASFLLGGLRYHVHASLNCRLVRTAEGRRDRACDCRRYHAVDHSADDVHLSCTHEASVAIHA